MKDHKLLATLATAQFDQIDAEFKQILNLMTTQEKIETVLQILSVKSNDEAIAMLTNSGCLAAFCCLATGYAMASVMTAEMQGMAE